MTGAVISGVSQLVPFGHHYILRKSHEKYMEGLVFLKKVRRIRFLATTQGQPVGCHGVEAGLDEERE